MYVITHFIDRVRKIGENPMLTYHIRAEYNVNAIQLNLWCIQLEMEPTTVLYYNLRFRASDFRKSRCFHNVPMF